MGAWPIPSHRAIVAFFLLSIFRLFRGSLMIRVQDTAVVPVQILTTLIRFHWSRYFFSFFLSRLILWAHQRFINRGKTLPTPWLSVRCLFDSIRENAPIHGCGIILRVIIFWYFQASARWALEASVNGVS